MIFQDIKKEKSHFYRSRVIIKCNFFYPISILLLFLMLTVNIYAKNFIDDSNFENGLGSWSGNAVPGKSEFKITNSASGNALLLCGTTDDAKVFVVNSKYINVVKDSKYSFSLDLKSSAGIEVLFKYKDAAITDRILVNFPFTGNIKSNNFSFSGYNLLSAGAPLKHFTSTDIIFPASGLIKIIITLKGKGAAEIDNIIFTDDAGASAEKKIQNTDSKFTNDKNSGTFNTSLHSFADTLDIIQNVFFQEYFDDRNNLIYGCGGGNEGRNKNLPSPEMIKTGKPLPYGHGTGMSDTALMGGEFLGNFSIIYNKTENKVIGEWAKKIFAGLVYLAETAKAKGFIMRGPHPLYPDAYYIDSSGDQHWMWLFGMYFYYHSKPASEKDKTKIAELVNDFILRLEKNNWLLLVENDSIPAVKGNPGPLKSKEASVHYLSALAAAHSLTGSEKWGTMYEEACREKNSERTVFMQTKDLCPRSPYSGQEMNLLLVLSHYDKNPERKIMYDNMRIRMAKTALVAVYPDDLVKGHAPEINENEKAECGKYLKLDGAADWRKRLNPELLYRTGPWGKSEETKSWGIHHNYAIVRWPLIMFEIALKSGDREMIKQVSQEVRDLIQTIDWENYQKGLTWETRIRAILAGELVQAEGY
ncbi:MAG: hypothetical protein A2096_01760 [Spirochaetes bacterium GWF1_41_5]|nr:MAG: hypothetical protein A2096_01760 [Spirochaetes bacterium GWF1_41_5]